jgi:plasmid stabilization system protein ParE
MTARLVIQPEAEADLQDAFAWYERRRAGLGDKMLEEARLAFIGIGLDPTLPRPRYRQSRRVPLKRFPYVVLYVFRHDTVYVLGVLHERRSPLAFRNRTI